MRIKNFGMATANSIHIKEVLSYISTSHYEDRTQ